MDKIPFVPLTQMSDEEMKALEESARQQGDIPRRQSLQRSPPPAGKRKHSCSGRVMTTDDEELNKSIEKLREEDARLEREAKKLKEWQPDGNKRREESTKKQGQGQEKNIEAEDKKRGTEKVREQRKRQETEETTREERKKSEEEEARRDKEKEVNQSETTETTRKEDKQDTNQDKERSKAQDNHTREQDKEKEEKRRREAQRERQVNQEKERTREMVLQITEAREKIITATTRYSGSKIQFNKDEQNVVREEIDNMSKLMIEMAYKIGELQSMTTQEITTQQIEVIRKGIEQISQKIDKQKNQQEKYIQTIKDQTNKNMEEIRKLRNTEQSSNKTTTIQARDNRQGPPTNQHRAEDTQTENETDEGAMTLVNRRRKRRTYAQMTADNKDGERAQGWKTQRQKTD